MHLYCGWTSLPDHITGTVGRVERVGCRRPGHKDGGMDMRERVPCCWRMGSPGEDPFYENVRAGRLFGSYGAGKPFEHNGVYGAGRRHGSEELCCHATACDAAESYSREERDRIDEAGDQCYGVQQGWHALRYEGRFDANDSLDMGFTESETGDGIDTAFAGEEPAMASDEPLTPSDSNYTRFANSLPLQHTKSFFLDLKFKLTICSLSLNLASWSPSYPRPLLRHHQTCWHPPCKMDREMAHHKSRQAAGIIPRPPTRLRARLARRQGSDSTV